MLFLIKIEKNKVCKMQHEHNILINNSYLYLSLIYPHIGPTKTVENPVKKELYCKTVPLTEVKAPYTLNVFFEKCKIKDVNTNTPTNFHNLLFFIADLRFFV